MCENNHPALKLFGWNIPVPHINSPTTSDLVDTRVNEKTAQLQQSSMKDSNNQDRVSVMGDDKEASEALVLADENHVNPRLKGEQAQMSSADQDKVVKKPDKILQCPRCNSLETKFCYFNNYNVNQPRHFCRNCQRYWTAGGTMRNVPVGAGRKKNKLFASRYHHILVSSDPLSANRINTSDMVNPQLISSGESTMACEPSVGDSAFLFGPAAPLCESMKVELNLGVPNRCGRGFVAGMENGENLYSCGTTVPPSSNSNMESNKNSHQMENITEGGSCDQFKQMPLLSCNSISPRLFPWNSGWKNGASMTTIQKPSDPVYVSKSSNLNLVQWPSGPMLAIPGFHGPNMPLQLVSDPNQSFMPLLSPVGGNVSLTARGGCPSPSSSTSNSCCSSNGSPTLGKHSRDTKLSKEEKTEKSVLLSKTLKIDDHHNTLKSR